MEKETLRKTIIKKFETLSKFSRLSGFDRYELQKVFARKDNDPLILREISHLAKDTDNITEITEITPSQIKSLTEALNKAGGVIEFCNKNDKFSRLCVYQVLSGKRKRITPKVQELFDHFKI